MTETLGRAATPWTVDGPDGIASACPQSASSVSRFVSTALGIRPGSGSTQGGAVGYLSDRQAVAVVAAMSAEVEHPWPTRIAQAVLASSSRFIFVTADAFAAADDVEHASTVADWLSGRGPLHIIDTNAVARRLNQERETSWAT